MSELLKSTYGTIGVYTRHTSTCVHKDEDTECPAR
jgi:hypothetical protein